MHIFFHFQMYFLLQYAIKVIIIVLFLILVTNVDHLLSIST